MKTPWVPFVLGLALTPAPTSGQFIAAPYNAAYSLRTLVRATPVPGLPQRYGSLVFSASDPDTVLIGGSARTPQGGLYALRVVRNAGNHITGFAGAGVLFASAPDVDGGVVHGPGGVLLFTRDPTNGIGQIKPGSSVPNRIVDLTPLGVAASTGGLAHVPSGYPGAGRLKITARDGWFDAALQPDGFGTYDVVAPLQRVTLMPWATAPLYLPAGSPLFTDYRTLLVCEYSSGTVAAYDIDNAGDPIPASRRLFAQQLVNVRGAAIDPRTGDLLFTTNGAGNEIFVVERTAACGSLTPYGNGTAGGGGQVPLLSGSGCPTPGQTVTLSVTNGLASTPGALLLGVRSTAIFIVGGIVLVVPDLAVSHRLDATGAVRLPIPLPADNNLVGQNFFLQTVYFDPGAPGGVSMTRGLQMSVR